MNKHLRVFGFWKDSGAALLAAHPKNTARKPTMIEIYPKMLPVSHKVSLTPEN